MEKQIFAFPLLIMEKQIGKLYGSSHDERRNGKLHHFELVIFCTGYGRSRKTFSGVVVKQTDDFSDHKLGNCSDTWTWNEDIFQEYDKELRINNKKWKEPIIMGDCCCG